MIQDILVVKAEILEHDPLYPIIEFNNKYCVWKCSKRHSMSFIRPRFIEFYEYDYTLNRYNLMITEHTKQYYRPAEFYDHYCSPCEINNMSDNTIKDYIKFYKDKNCLFECKIYEKFITMKRRNIMECIQHIIQEENYRIITELSDHVYSNRKIIFDETWNTIFYYHLLLPKRKMYFINIKNFTCTCKKISCIHVSSILLRLLVFRYLQNNLDLYYILKDLI